MNLFEELQKLIKESEDKFKELKANIEAADVKAAECRGELNKFNDQLEATLQSKVNHPMDGIVDKLMS